jgi:transcriptional regulator with XRE-family HTH domain
MFWLKFEKLCKSIGSSPTAVSLILGFSNATATKWKAGSVPSGKSLQKIADHFGVTVDYLLGNETEQKKPPADIGEELSEGQRKLIEFARSVPEDKIDLVLKVMQSIVEAD